MTVRDRAFAVLDLAGLLLWLALARAAKLLLAVARPFALLGWRFAVSLFRKSGLDRNPLALELRDLAFSPAMARLLDAAQDFVSSLARLLDASKAARRMLLLAAFLLALRAVLFEELDLPHGTWSGPAFCVASYYDKGFLGKPTASGEIFSPYEFTAAHRSLPFGTRLKLRNPANGRETLVRINDRGPFVEGRELDLSRAAAKALGIYEAGLGRLEVRILRKTP